MRRDGTIKRAARGSAGAGRKDWRVRGTQGRTQLEAA
jgi:hypothetical protein